MPMIAQHAVRRMQNRTNQRKHRNRPEQGLQITVMKYLDRALPKEAIAFHVPNGGGRSKAEAGLFKVMGVKPGIPDIIIFYAGRTYCVELKADKKGATDSQHDMHEKLRDQGIPVVIARSLETVETFLADHGVKLSARIAV